MQHQKLTIKQWAEEDRPREKLSLQGVNALTNAELIAVLLGSGTKNESAVDIAKQLLATFNHDLFSLGQASILEYQKIKGIGNARAVILAAAFELGRRRQPMSEKKIEQISSSNDVFLLLGSKLSELKHEEFWVIYLSRNNSILLQHKISQGGIAGTVIDVRLIAKKAIDVLASGIILVHNHPSGNTTPSKADIHITNKMVNAAKIIDCNVLDHIIIAGEKYYSFADEGII